MTARGKTTARHAAHASKRTKLSPRQEPARKLVARERTAILGRREAPATGEGKQIIAGTEGASLGGHARLL